MTIRNKNNSNAKITHQPIKICCFFKQNKQLINNWLYKIPKYIQTLHMFPYSHFLINKNIILIQVLIAVKRYILVYLSQTMNFLKKLIYKENLQYYY